MKVIEVHDLIHGLCGTGCDPDFAFGLQNMRVIDAMNRSMTSRQWETV